MDVMTMAAFQLLGWFVTMVERVDEREGGGGVACDRHVARAAAKRVPNACGMARS